MIDFLVIGGGVAGLSAAARLSEHGTVTVLEQEDALGFHASGRSAALFEPNYGADTVKVLSRASEDYHRSAYGGYLSPRGLMLLGAAEDAHFEKDRTYLGCDEISVADAQTRVPILNTDHVRRAAFRDGAEDIDTDRLLQDFAKTIRKTGGQVETHAAVTDIRKMHNGWAISTATTTYEGRLLVNAAGPWADEIARLAGRTPIGLSPLRRSMARIPIPGDHDLTHWPMFFGVGETWYAKPDAGQLIVSPAEEDPCPPMDAYPDDMVLAEGFARYQDFVRPKVTRPTATWAGLRTFAPDRTLVLGPDPIDPSFIWSVGQGGYGFQTAPAASQLVADLTVGNAPEFPPDIVAALSPNRFT
ncbi:MAG: FAD-binding oxidoreductase [Pseudomonadota bacterium]